MIYKLLCQKWEESEADWGTRPDGYSLHVDSAALEKFVSGYWARLPKDPPQEYSRPRGAPYLCDVTEEVYNYVVAHQEGLGAYVFDLHTAFNWIQIKSYPYPGGKDGWRVEDPQRLDQGPAVAKLYTDDQNLQSLEYELEKRKLEITKLESEIARLKSSHAS